MTEEASLLVQHVELERLIEEENARPRPDSGKLSDLKRQKLLLKDQIEKIAPASPK